ncbi:DUF998 domain-containing protein [Halorubrum gandharaense]
MTPTRSPLPSLPPEGAHERARLAGAGATLVALGGILLATLLDPTFSWADDALSDLGVRPRSTPVFNGALVLAGLVGLGYAPGLWRVGDGDGGRLLPRAVAVVFALSMVGLAGVGLFDLTHQLHFPAAVGFYLLVTLAFALDGVARRRTRTGRITLTLAPLHVLGWWTWTAGYWGVSGLALPELFGALLFAAWVWVLGPLPVVERA